jgi:hypothetical protein
MGVEHGCVLWSNASVTALSYIEVWVERPPNERISAMSTSPAAKDLKDLIREGVRTTIHQTLGSVIQEVTEEELRAALRDQSLRNSPMEAVRHELRQAIEELRANGKKARHRRPARK